MTRVAIIGNAGGGKSTLCLHLSKTHNLPVYHVDKLQWKPGWVPVPTEEFHQKHQELLTLERWIIDGWGPMEDIEARFQLADTIIFVDHPLIIHYWWAIKRQVKCLFQPRLDLPENCPMLPMTWKLFRTIWTVHHTHRPHIAQLINKFSGTKQLIHITSPQNLRAFIHKHCST